VEQLALAKARAGRRCDGLAHTSAAFFEDNQFVVGYLPKENSTAIKLLF